MQELSLHILDIIQNSIRAEATQVKLLIEENMNSNLLTISIEDNGKGMSDEMAKNVKNPFVTSRTLRKVGLGIPLLSQLCAECNGEVIIESKENIGTKIIATMQYDHIDRLPLGDMAKTITTLIMGKPDIHYIYTHFFNNESFTFDTEEIKAVLDGVPIENLEVLAWIQQYITENLRQIKTN